MRNYALITTALITTMGALLLGLTVSHPAMAQDELTGTLPNPATMSGSAQPVFQPAAMPIAATAPAPVAPAATTTTTTTTVVPAPAPSAQLPVHTTPSAATPAPAPVVPVAPASASNPIPPIGGAAPASALTTSPATPQIVQDAVTRLQKVDQINLDDMIRAQDAINRLDLLLEIEKRQSELKKIRDERTKSSASSSMLGSAIPASALNLPKISAPSLSDNASTIKPVKVSAAPPPPAESNKYSIKRISGTDGRYFAVITLDDNSSQTIRAGDKLPDGSLVKSINLTSVSLFKDKKSKTLTIPTDSYIVREAGTSAP